MATVHVEVIGKNLVAQVGRSYDKSDNFFVGNSFPTCGINFTAQEIMGQTKENQ